MTAFFYIESAPGCIFSTQTRSADISSKINCWEWLVESETKTSAVTWQHANYHSRNSVEVQCFPGFTRIKRSNHANAADWYMWNITDILETFRNVTLTVTVTVRGVRRLWRHRIVCIWNAPIRRPNRKCQHMTVSAADNRTRFTVSGHAKFHPIFRENDIDLLYFNKQFSKCITHL